MQPISYYTTVQPLQAQIQTQTYLEAQTQTQKKINK